MGSSCSFNFFDANEQVESFSLEGISMMTYLFAMLGKEPRFAWSLFHGDQWG
jgi:hypothetical protein